MRGGGVESVFPALGPSFVVAGHGGVPMASNSGADVRKHATAIADLIADYRRGEVEKPTPEHVTNWLDQLEEDERTKARFLAELHHVLSQTYVSRPTAVGFLKGLVKSNKLAGKDPCGFWKRSHILSIQKGGASQADLREIFGEVLDEACSLDIDECTAEAGPFIYLDDAVFTGMRVVNDVRDWLAYTPKEVSFHVVAMAVYSAGDFNLRAQIAELAREAKKRVDVTVWSQRFFVNHSNQGAASDVLRLRSFPRDEASKLYIEEHGDPRSPQLLRPENERNTSKLFSNEESRDLLERVFWKAGLKVRDLCQHLKTMHRPLGYTSTNSKNKLGFGSLFVSYRNCPNNCPLALWAGDPWYPLLPRKTN